MLKLRPLLQLILQVVDPAVLRTHVLLHFLELTLESADLLLQHIVLPDDLLVLLLQIPNKVVLRLDLPIQRPMMV